MKALKMKTGIISLFFFICVSLSAAEFEYKKTDDGNIEFKVAGKTFTFGRSGLVFDGIEIKKADVLIHRRKNKITLEPWELGKSKGIRKVEAVLTTENTRIVKVIVSEENFKFEVQYIFQIWKDIPALSVEFVVKNFSEDKIDFSHYWICQPFPKSYFYTTSVKGNETCSPNPGKWEYLSHEDYFLLHAEKALEGLGFIGLKNFQIVMPNPCNIMKSLKVAPGESSEPFKIIFADISRGYGELKEINEKIKILEAANKTGNPSGISKEDAISFALGGKLHYVPVKFETPPSIDGDLKEWTSVSPIFLGKENMLAKGETTFTWGGNEDLSARIYLGYDDENLYLACETTDNIFHQKYSGSNIWKGDSIQFTIDPLNNEGELLQSDDYDYAFALTSSGPYVHCMKSPAVQDLKDISLMIKYKGEGKKETYIDPALGDMKGAIDHGLVYEAKIPWKYIYPFKASGIFGINFLIPDNDGAGLKQYLCWSKPKDGQWKAPSGYGKILCGENALSSLIPAEYSLSVLSQGKTHYLAGADIPVKIIIYSLKNESFNLKLEVKKENSLLEEKIIPLELKQGFNSVDYILKTTENQFGKHRIEVTLHDKENNSLIRRMDTFLLLTKGEIEKKMSALKNAVPLFEASIEKTKKLGIDTSYPGVVLATVKLYIPWTEDEIKYGNYFRADKNLEYLSELHGSGMKELENMVKNQDERISVPKYDLNDLKIRNGFFYSKDTPCFFFGHVIRRPNEDIIKMPDLGCNLARPWGIRACPRNVLKSEKEILTPEMRWFDEALKLGVALDPYLGYHNFPSWAVDKYPEIKGNSNANYKKGNVWQKISLEHPVTRKILEKNFRIIIPLLKEKPALLGYGLALEDGYNCRGDIGNRMFRNYLEKKHTNIGCLNKAWNTDYKNFEEINPPPEDITKITNFPHFQEWCLFNQRTFFDFLKWQKDIIREYDSKKPIYAGYKCHGPGDYARNGYLDGGDIELVTGLSDMMCLDSSIWIQHPDYALDHWAALFAYDLMHSIAPEKVIADAEWHGISPGIVTGVTEDYSEAKIYNFLRTALWQAFLRGVSVIESFQWTGSGAYRDGKKDIWPFCDDLPAKPVACYSTGRTSLEIRRLADSLARFSQEKAEAALLYSHYSIPSLPRFPSFHDENLRIAYEGTFFLDAKLAFITERQISSGMAGNYKLIIIPSAKRVKESTCQKLKEYVKNGGTVLVSENSLEYDEYENARDISSFMNGKEITIGNLRLSVNNFGKGKVYYIKSLPPPKDIGKLCDILFDDLKIKRPIRILSDSTERQWGIESRTVQLNDNKYLTYLINISKNELKVKLSGKNKIIKIRNIITGKKIENTIFNLPVLSPILMEVEMQ